MNPDRTLIVLLTGPSGSGKSALVRKLRESDHVAVSLDGHAGVCAWTDLAGVEVQRPEHPDLAWLKAHQWRWRRDRLAQLIDELRRTEVRMAILTGVAANLPDCADLFDIRILLRLNRATILQRLDDPSRGNDFGKVGDSRTYLESVFQQDQDKLAALCDVEVDASGPLHEVLEAVLLEASMAWLAHNRP